MDGTDWLVIYASGQMKQFMGMLDRCCKFAVFKRLSWLTLTDIRTSVVRQQRITLMSRSTVLLSQARGVSYAV